MGREKRFKKAKQTSGCLSVSVSLKAIFYVGKNEITGEQISDFDFRYQYKMIQIRGTKGKLENLPGLMKAGL